MTKSRLLWTPLIVAFAATASAYSARADEYVLILLDQTGSMCADNATCPKTVPSGDWTQLPTWINAINDARAWVTSDQGSNPTTTQRYYSIWTFKNTQDGQQTNAVQLWPTAAFSDGCTKTVTTTSDASFCQIAKLPTGYVPVLNALEAIKDKAGQIPQATWLTPLADSLCRGLSEVWPSNNNQNRTIIFESDGGENFSNSISPTCFGQPATNITTTTSWQSLVANKTTSDWGILPVGAWQANVLRRATRLQFAPPPYDVQEAAAVGAGPLGGGDQWPTFLTMKVSVNYSLCSPEDTDPVCVISNQTSPLTATHAANGLRIDSVGGAVQTVAAASLAAAPFAATATVTRTPSIKASELGFFRALGGATPSSKFREVVRNPSVVYGVPHTLAGDVDDSNCVDRADYSIVTQKDVWMQQAVQPLQIAIRADLNRDGWVNEADRSIVLANWGHGCINNPGPKPTP